MLLKEKKQQECVTQPRFFETDNEALIYNGDQVTTYRLF